MDDKDKIIQEQKAQIKSLYDEIKRLQTLLVDAGICKDWKKTVPM